MMHGTIVRVGCIAMLFGLSRTLVAFGEEPANPGMHEGNPRAIKMPIANHIETVLDACVPIADSAAHSEAFNMYDVPSFKVGKRPPDYTLPGIAELGVLVDASGNGRFAHVTSALPPDPSPSLVASAVKVANEGTYVSAKRGGQPVTMWLHFRVVTGGISPNNMFGKQDTDKWLKAAREGDGASMAIMSALYGTIPTVQLTHHEYRHFVISSALLGRPTEQAHLAKWLRPKACHKDGAVEEVRHELLLKGDRKAAVVEAMDELKDNDASNYQQVATLLRGAADSPDPFVRMWAAGILATSPVSEIRDPATALQTALTLRDSVRDPDYAEVLAAAQAASGHFEEAISVEESALEFAKERHWNDTQIRLRLESYRSHHAWTGYLCDCTNLAPDSNL
jgi:hypothetical protein